MNDTKSASLVLVVGAAGVAYWWYQLTNGKLAPPSAGATGPLGEGAGKSLQPSSGGLLGRLEAFAAQWGLTITSGLRPGDKGSLHSEGRAVDVAVPHPSVQGQVQAAADALGIHILREEYTSRPGDGRPRSTAPHWHLSFPRIKNGRLVW